MGVVAQIIRWEIIGFLAALAAIVTLQLLTGQINMRGLFWGRVYGRLAKDDRRYFSPERVQLLLFTLAAAGTYLSMVVNNPHPGTFPDVPERWPALLGGSNLVYLARKAYARWLARR